MSKKPLEKKYQKIWHQCLPYFRKGRSGDIIHAKTLYNSILDYNGSLKLDLDILVPVAMMHDIGHYAILPEHLKFVTGEEKIQNGKLVHMLTGAKIAKDILEKVKYNKQKTREIVEIISMHDWDQLDVAEAIKRYDTLNTKIFHDFDCLDRYNIVRLSQVSLLFKNKRKLQETLKSLLNTFFFKEFRKIAEKKLQKLTF